MLTPEQELLLRAQDVRRAAGLSWAAFLDAFTAYADHVREQMLAAEIGQLPVAQGRARAMRELAAILTDARGEVEKIKGKIR